MALPLGSCGAPSPDDVDGGGRTESIESAEQRLAAAVNPVLGTIDMRAAAVGVNQSAIMGQLLGGWNLNYLDTMPPLIGDFDGDTYDDFVLRSAWGVGMIGNDTSDNLRSIAMAAYGSTWGSWTLQASDRLVAVAKLGTENHASAIIQGANGLGVMRPSAGGFAIDTFANGSFIGGWGLSANDKVVAAGNLGSGVGDAFIITSPWGLGIMDRQAGSTSLRTVAMWANTTMVGGFTLDTTDPSFRVLGIGQFDGSGNPEFLVQSRLGMAMFRLDPGNVLKKTAWTDHNTNLACRTDGTNSWCVSTRDAFIAFKDLNADGRDDLLFQTPKGIFVLRYSNNPNDPFLIEAQHAYGTPIGGWNFSADDRLLPVVGDFDGNGVNDFTIQSEWGLGNLTVLGADIGIVAGTTWSTLTLANERSVIGSGRFRHDAVMRYLFKNPNPNLFTTRTPVATQHNDNGRTGAYYNETVLTPAQVGSRWMKVGQFYTMDSGSNSQPLYVPDLVVNGVKKDVVIATDNTGHVYWFDANATTDTYLVKKALSDPETGSGRTIRGLGQGIAGTPVVDMQNELLYVLFQTANAGEDSCWRSNIDVAFWLTALDLHTGNPVRSARINATYPNTQQAFTFQTNPNCPVMPATSIPAGRSDFISQNQNSRAAMLLDHGKIYLAFGMQANEESRYYKGWVLRYDAQTFEQQGVFNVAPEHHGYDGGGIWGGGAGMAADAAGNVYVMTGNGPAVPFNSSYGDSFLKLAPRGKTLQLAGSFSPGSSVWCDANKWAAADVDLGSGGVLLVPGTDRMIGGGKSGELAVLSTSAMTPGVVCASSPGTVQFFQAFINSFPLLPPQQNTYDTIGWQGGPHLHGSPIYWRGGNANYGYLYHWAEKDYPRQFKYNVSTGTLDTVSLKGNQTTTFPTNVVLSPNTQWTGGDSVMPGGMMSLSAQGNVAGTAVLWSVSHWCPDLNNCADPTDRLSAFNAETMALLYTSTVNTSVIPKWQMGHWAPPLIADGKVFVATANGRMMRFVLN